MHNISNLFYLEQILHVSDGLSVHHQESKSVHIPDAVCTDLDSWWRTDRPSETCRVLFQNKINLRYCSSGWFYYRSAYWSCGFVSIFLLCHFILFTLHLRVFPYQVRLALLGCQSDSGEGLAKTAGVSHYFIYAQDLRTNLILSNGCWISIIKTFAPWRSQFECQCSHLIPDMSKFYLSNMQISLFISRKLVWSSR